MARGRKRFGAVKKLFVYGLGSVIFAVGAGSVWALTIDVPDFEAFDQRKIIQSTKIYDRSGDILLYDIHNDIRRTVVKLADIPPSIRNATVAIEDSSFYNHRGVRPFAIVRA